MSQTLDQILGGPNLTGVIQQTSTGIPDVFPASFYASRRPVDGDTAEYTRIDGSRQTARIAAYGSPSQQRELKNVAKVPVKLIHTIESVLHKPHVLTNLLNFTDLSKQQLGIAEVTRQTRQFRQLFDNLRVAALTSMLFAGNIYFDGNGSLLPNSTGAKITVNYGVPSGNTLQLNALGAGNILDLTWDNAAANIATQLSNLKKAARKLTGYPLVHAFYGQNVLDYLLNNNKAKELMKFNPAANARTLAGDVPSNLFGLEWHPAYEAFFEDDSGTAQDLVGGDQVLFTPEPSMDWLDWLEGTYPVPTTVGAVTNDAIAATGNVSVATGMFSYAQVLSDPVTVKQIAGDTFLPVLKVPKAIFIATVKF
jgi:hypothetical protein